MIGEDTSAYEAVIADLVAKIQEMKTALAAIEKLSGLKAEEVVPAAGVTTGAEHPASTSKIRSDTFFNMGTQDAILKCLAIQKKPLSASDITKLLESGGITTSAKNFYNSVSTSLRRLRKSGDVVQLQDKTWGKADWYPALSRKKNDDAPEAECVDRAAAEDAD